jgi:large subunit ribosomal protein L9
VKIVLRSDVVGLGKKGDLREVADGYARNYLLPKGLALVATRGAEAQAESMRRARTLRAASERSEALELADVLSAKPLRITAKAGKEGKLFGSVGANDIVAALAEQTGAHIDRRSIEMGEPIKTVGEHQVVAHLHGDVDVTLSVVVAT